MKQLFLIIRKCIYISLGWVDHILGKQSSIVVLCYHSVGDAQWRFTVSEKMFEKQMKTIQKTHTPVSLQMIEAYLRGKGTLPSHAYAVTFDDGYADLLNSIQICKTLKIIPTVYVLAQPQKADRSVLDNELPLLDSDQLQTLLKSGWDIGCHTSTHVVLDKKGKNSLTKEITQAKKILEEQLKCSITSFAFPKGRYSDRVIDVVQQSGYSTAVTMDDTLLNKHTDRYRIPRIGVDGSHSMVEFTSLYSPGVIAFRNVIKKSPLGRYF